MLTGILYYRTATGGTHSQTQVFLETLNEIIQLRPEAVEHVLGQYYRVLGRCCHNMGPDSQLPGLLRTALVAPLVADGVSGPWRPFSSVALKENTDFWIGSFTQSAYRDFAFSFLTQQNLVIFERNVGAFAADVDTDRLSETLLAAAPGEPKTADSLNALLWLLAHFIALQRARPRQTLHLHYLRALHLLLSALTNQLRVHFSVSGDVRDAEEEALEAVPPYVAEQAVSLIDKEGITELLEKLTS
jgi:ubiquitin-protein ligase E3 C